MQGAVAELRQMKARLQRVKSLAAEYEAKKRALQEQLVVKDAISQGLPRVEVARLSKPALDFVRLSNPKEDGQSLKKKQCDLWEFCWGSSSLLAYVLTSNVVDFNGKRVLEVGGGIGVATLAIARSAKAEQCVMTDLVDDALKIFNLNRHLGGFISPIVTHVLDWNHPEKFPHSGPYDIIVGSDVLFMSWCAKPLARVVAQFLSSSGLLIIVDPYRLNDVVFIENLEAEGVAHHALFDFTTEIIDDLLSQEVLDKQGSVVPVKQAKLIVASKSAISTDVIDRVTKLGLLRL